MANSDKNIVITPNTGSASTPTIVFTGGSNTPGTLTVNDAGTLSFDKQFISSVATGTAPFAVTSTTRVANLNVATAGTADTVTNGVYTTGDQTIGGTKTFSNTVKIGASNAYEITTTGFAYFPSASQHLAYYKKNGGYAFYWRRSDDGAVGGANETTLMTLIDSGNLTVTGTVTAPTFSGALSGNATTATSAGFITGTNIGKTGSQGFISTTAWTPQSWANQPMSGLGMTVNNTPGAPTTNFGYFNKFGNRDAGGPGWGGMWMEYDGGSLHYGATLVSSSNATWKRVLDSANYNTYSPTLTGTGASGTWSINVTGSAGSATTATNQSGGTVSATSIATSGSITATGNNNYSYQFGHGNYERLVLPAGNNGAGSGEAGLYLWISEPAVTWTAAGIGRNRRNSTTGFPRINTALSANMIRFLENDGLEFSGITSGGTAYTHANMSASNLLVYGDVTAYASDRRLKKNPKVIENSLEKVLSLSGIYFDWIDNIEKLGFHPKRKLNDAGLFAQDVEKVLPQAIESAPFDQELDPSTQLFKSKSGEDYLTVNYSKLVPLLVNAIKEQQEQINEQAAEIAEIKKFLMDKNMSAS